MQTEAQKKEARRVRRRRNRALSIVFFVTACVGLAWFFESQATTTLIFVRHADKASVPVDDPSLTAPGRARAQALANVLADVDVVASVDAVYVTQYKRTAETAMPLAQRADVDLSLFDPSDLALAVNQIVKDHKGEIVLVVGHSNTIAPMIAELGGSKKLPDIGESEYDNLYIVSIPWFGKVKTLRLRYGD
ncbi:MAG: phosphoglycerate mutase family protein [Pseudomonadota bacterium]